MKNPSNPMGDDIRQWAFDSEAEEPIQDWDLLLAAVPQTDLFLELASIKECPKADYFLALLYFIVGDAVRTGFQTHRRDEIESFLDKAEARFAKRRIYVWARRSRELIASPEHFRYDDWCAGGLAREDS